MLAIVDSDYLDHGAFSKVKITFVKTQGKKVKRFETLAMAIAVKKLLEKNQKEPKK